MSSRHVFYGHVLLLGVSIILGMSESYPWLAWAKAFGPIVSLLMLPNLAFPFVILVLAKKERKNPEKMLAAVMLSVGLTIGYFFALLPLVM